MTGLTFLNLSRNAIRSTIPNEFKNLAMLMDLDLSYNNFYGPLSLVLDKGVSEALGQYKTLDVSRNGFTGGIDENIGEFVAMEVVEILDFSYNPLGGGIPESMVKLSGLKEVRLANDGLLGGIPDGLLDLQELTEFDVSGNQLTGHIPRHETPLPAVGFSGNAGLCDDPLPPCGG